MKNLLVVLVVAVLLVTQFGQHWSKQERTVDIGKHSYAVEYQVCDEGCMVAVPATYPPGQPHYAARVKVFEIKSGERTPIGKEFGAEWTPKGCFEDDPHWLVQLALRIALDKKNDYCPSRDTDKDKWFSCIEKLQQELDVKSKPTLPTAKEK